MNDNHAEDGSDADDLQEVLVRVAFDVMGLLTQLAADEDLSLTQLRAMAILRDRTPRMADLATALGLDRSTITGLVARAEQRGLMRRVAVPGDGRSVHVVLTSDGAALAEELGARMAGQVSDLTHRVGPADRRRLRSLLQRLVGPAR